MLGTTTESTTTTTRYQSFEAVRLPGVGAELRGLDVSQPLDDGIAAELRRALLEYQVIVIRDQKIGPAEQTRFARVFGEIDAYPFAEPMPGHPGVVAVVKEPETELNFGGVWHSDSPYLEIPPKITVLYGVQIPPSGGDTMFADMYGAYERLAPELKAKLDAAQGVFSGCCVHLNDELKLGDVVRVRNDVVAERRVLHPLIRRHPETGRRALFMSRVHVEGIADMSTDESTPLLDYLASTAVAEPYTMRLRWSVGTLVAFDNRCVQHYAINDYPGHRREIHRIVVKGDERPFA